MTFNAFKIIIQLSSARGVADVYDFGKTQIRRNTARGKLKKKILTLEHHYSHSTRQDYHIEQEKHQVKARQRGRLK